MPKISPVNIALIFGRDQPQWAIDFLEGIEQNDEVNEDQVLSALTILKAANDDPRIRSALRLMKQVHVGNDTKAQAGRLFMEWTIVLVQVFRDVDAAAAQTKKTPTEDPGQGFLFQGII